jgi:hypothetical protein
MKRYKCGIILACALMVIVGSLLYIKPWGTKPLKDLTAENITSMSIMLGPPGVDIPLSDEQVEECVSLLRQVVVYHRKGGFMDNRTNGQIVRITIIDTSNREMVISFFGNISVTVDGVKYKVKYEESEALNAFANALHDQ